MRLHSDIITLKDLNSPLLTQGLPGVKVFVTPHGSRSRERAYEVRLEGNGGIVGHRRINNPLDPYGPNATWDEWGVVIARLFDIDPASFWGGAKRPVYSDEWDYHYQTAHRFSDLALPEDTHKRHHWEYKSPRQFACKKCSAEKVYP